MIFHLAIPAKDLKKSVAFYKKIGAEVGRSYKKNVILRFRDMQLVLHKGGYDKKPSMYPRHFGFILEPREYKRAKKALLKYQFLRPQVRYQSAKGQHETFFLCDPANNLIEFKCYKYISEIF